MLVAGQETSGSTGRVAPQAAAINLLPPFLQPAIRKRPARPTLVDATPQESRHPIERPAPPSSSHAPAICLSPEPHAMAIKAIQPNPPSSPLVASITGADWDTSCVDAFCQFCKLYNCRRHGSQQVMHQLKPHPVTKADAVEQARSTAACSSHCYRTTLSNVLPAASQGGFQLVEFSRYIAHITQTPLPITS